MHTYVICIHICMNIFSRHKMWWFDAYTHCKMFTIKLANEQILYLYICPWVCMLVCCAWQCLYVCVCTSMYVGFSETEKTLGTATFCLWNSSPDFLSIKGGQPHGVLREGAPIVEPYCSRQGTAAIATAAAPVFSQDSFVILHHT